MQSILKRKKNEGKKKKRNGGWVRRVVGWGSKSKLLNDTNNEKKSEQTRTPMRGGIV